MSATPLAYPHPMESLFRLAAAFSDPIVRERLSELGILIAPGAPGTPEENELGIVLDHHGEPMFVGFVDLLSEEPVPVNVVSIPPVKGRVQ